MFSVDFQQNYQILALHQLWVVLKNFRLQDNIILSKARLFLWKRTHTVSRKTFQPFPSFQVALFSCLLSGLLVKGGREFRWPILQSLHASCRPTSFYPQSVYYTFGIQIKTRPNADSNVRFFCLMTGKVCYWDIALNVQQNFGRFFDPLLSLNPKPCGMYLVKLPPTPSCDLLYENNS
jgi:hypothetical protein